jgi:hypothetical protein
MMKRDLNLNRFFSRLVALFFLLVLPLLWFLPSAQATVWYVRQEAVPGGDGNSWHDAFNNIQEAIDEANSSDQIFVKKGTYSLSATLSIVDKGPAIYGGFSGLEWETSPEDADPAASPTIIDGGNSIRCIYILLEASSFGAPIIDGFTIRNGKADYEGSLSDYGGGIWIRGGGMTLRPLIRNCMFTENFAGRGGGAVALEGSSADFVNSTFWKNSVDTYTTASFGGAINILGGTPVFTNCVFYANTARTGGAVYNAGANAYFWNTILWGNTGWEGTQIYSVDSPHSSTVHLEFCNIQGGPSGAYGGYFTTPPLNVISSDPRWAGPDGGNFHLRETSPCIDTGSNSAPLLPARDFERNDRIVDGNGDGTATVDMGVDEFVPGALTFGVWYVDGSVPASGAGTSWATAKRTIEEAVTAAPSGDQIWIKAGTYEPASTPSPFGSRIGIVITKAISIYGGFAGTETSLAQRNLAGNPVIIKGMADAYTFDIRDIGQAYPVVLDGLNFEDTVYQGAILSGQSGTLITDCNFRRNITGVYAVTGTIRSCSFSGNKRGIYVSGWSGNTNTLTVDGCTFANNANDLAGSEGGWGGGVYVRSYGNLALNGSSFTGNSAVYGGAVTVYSNGTAALTNCLFGGDNAVDGNTAQYGGAVYGYSNSSIQTTACAFRNNTATTSGGGMEVMNSHAAVTGGTFALNSAPDGGGLAFRTQYGTWTRSVTGVTFDGNIATGKGGGAFVESNSATFSDCIFTGNSARWGGGLDGNGRVTNSLFRGNTAQYGAGAYFARDNLACDIVHSLFYNNSATYNGGGIYSLYAFSATNSIFADNDAGSSGSDVYNYYGYTMTISNCRITQGSFAGTNGNIDNPPQFVNAETGNFRLQETSPCIDVGTLTPPGGLPLVDLGGNPRPMDGNYDGIAKPDMGAYEMESGPVLPGDVDRSDVVDLADAISALQTISGNLAGPVFGAASITGDGKIGIAEAVYALQHAAELRR